MTQCTKLSLLFVILGSALCSPFSHGNFNNMETRILETPTFDKGDINEQNDDIKKASECSSTFQQDERSDCNRLEANSENEERSTYSMLRIPESSYVQELEPSPYNSGSNVLPVIPSYMQSVRPLPQVWTRSPYGYQVNPSSLEAMGVGVGNNGGVLYPHVHPKLLAAMNQGFTINSLPPVRSTYIHSTYPGLRPNYDTSMDIQNRQNTMILASNLRPVRMLRSEEEDFLAELEHDAMMNNIIPTMQVRYASSVPYSNEPVVSAGPAIAVFPNAPYSSCSQPILLSCTPKVTRGVLAQQKPASPENAQLEATAAQHAYRQQGQTDDVTHKNDISVDHHQALNEGTPKVKNVTGASK